MNLDILRTEWAERDAKLESALRLNAKWLRETVVDKGRAEIDRLVPYRWGSITVWLVTLVLLAIFLKNHFGEWRFFVPAAAIFVWTVAEGALGLQMRLDMRAIDYGRPLVEVQRQVEAVRLRRLRQFQWAFLSGQIVWWIPLFIVVMAALGVDLYANEFMRTFMIVNVAFGLAVIPVALWATKAIGRRFAGSGWLRGIVDGIAGPDVVAARAFAEKLGEFEREA